MTILKSRLVTPDGAPIVGRRVTATLMTRPSWISKPDNGGRALGSVTGYTDACGMWRIELMPVTQFEDPDYVWYQIDEGGEQTWRVRFEESEGEVWLKDKLVDPPPPPPDYVAIDKLGSLHDVDRDSVEHAPEGAVLVKRDGQWKAEMPGFAKDRLSELYDVDQSVSWATYQDTLTYLGSSRGWGVDKPKPPTISASLDYDSEDPMAVWVTVNSFDRAKQLFIYWGDESEDTPIPEPEQYSHTYTAAGDYYLSVYYPDGESVDWPTTPVPKPAEES